MKAFVWGIAGFLALLWSAGIATLASVSGWLARSADAGLGGIGQLGTLTLPPWVEVWLEPSWREPLLAFAVWSQEAFAWITPWVGPVLEWIAPLLWVFWGVGMLVLLLVAASGQFLIGKLRSAPAA